MIKIYDTKTRTKREFVPVNEGKVGMYVCGPTVYNYIHIGNAHAAHGGAGNGKAGGGFIAFHKRILHNDPK